MRTFYNLLLLLSIVALGACNTLYNIHNITIEVIEPAKIILPENYRNIAVKYNNSNVEYHPLKSGYQDLDSIRIDLVNSDSISSKIYFDLFLENLQKHQYFNSISVLEPSDYTGILLVDSLVIKGNPISDSTIFSNEESAENKIRFFVDIMNIAHVKTKTPQKTKIIDPESGLYSKEELKSIADSTGAEALFSLDFYSSRDGIQFYPTFEIGVEYVYVMAFWNIYDLHQLQLRAFQPKIDTIAWRTYTYSQKLAPKYLPPRNDAIYNAADIAGTKFADYLIPHWIEENRIYYYSGQTELRKTKKLIEENKWMEAAKIWKANVNNRNKKISAKSKFNMALVCEMQGDYDAALDWVVQSFFVLGLKNEEHSINCQNYIRVLAKRKMELNIIDKQFFVDDVQTQGNDY